MMHVNGASSWLQLELKHSTNVHGYDVAPNMLKLSGIDELGAVLLLRNLELPTRINVIVTMIASPIINTLRRGGGTAIVPSAKDDTTMGMLS
jgi:hypothetical protein